MENEFLLELKKIILQNISNDQFGVSELANEVGMSRSNLLRKVQKHSQLSVSQFIRQVRLEEALGMLIQGDKTISEISYEVGFSSTSYFTKCFREQYGYPPGEANKQSENKDVLIESSSNKWKWITGAVALVLILVTITSTIYLNQKAKALENIDHSIAVLPFINDSADSSNVYFVNGLMESILNNLQQLEDLKVVSRTSVEKYRNSNKTIPEIANELGVSYILEGSGQKVGESIRLSVQLIMANNDDHLWAQQYNRELSDVFQIQSEVAEKIAERIHIIITPEEKQRLNEIPTDNMLAYDYFLKGLDLFNYGNIESLRTGIAFLHKAIDEDEDFARAHAALALAYHFLDIFQEDKQYADSVTYYADMSLLYQPKLAQGMTAKAMQFINEYDYEQAIIYLEKALEYNPNSALVINTLSELYTNHIPDTEKYLEYALKGISLDIASNDSSTASYIYLHLSNALIQTGFTNEAITAIDQSLAYNPENLFSEYVKAYILYARDRNLDQTKTLLLEALSRDTTRLDIIQELGNTCYYLRDWETSYQYFKKFLYIKDLYQLDIYIHKYAEIALVYDKMGNSEKSKQLLDQYKRFADNDESIYQHLNLSSYYSYIGNKEKALYHLELFSKEDNYQYWIPLFIPNDPIMDNIKDDPAFKQLMDKIETKFWVNHERLKTRLVEAQVLPDK